MYYKLGQDCVTNWGDFFYYKLGETLLQIGSFIITNWGNCCYKLGSYYKLGQPFLYNRAAITSWSKIYSKLGQVLQIRAIITN